MDIDEYNRWFNQAIHTLKSAYRDYKDGDYSWSCFKAQQAAEYAIKALLKAFGISIVGHSLVKLANDLDNAGINKPDDYNKWARKLDRDYIQPRYPDAYPSGSPYEYYDENDAKISLEYAQNILNYVEEYINECSNDNKGEEKE
ncbi:HEPN domain-containing protein [Thermoanaerobacterium thermosaccharolyticum]|uniref:HEPN domain-containing protein n=1 Tax=Thermoanaerobacterium thermosaccharolyticum TaxID=1517 RepID=UPI003DAA322A